MIASVLSRLSSIVHAVTPSRPTTPVTGLLPADIEAEEARLLKARHQVELYGRLFDGVLLGRIGLDAALGLVPVGGDVASALAAVWLLRKAKLLGVSRRDRIGMAALAAADGLVGSVPIGGDIADLFMRSHARNASRVVRHVDQRLARIESLRLLGAGRPMADDHPAADALRAVLFPVEPPTAPRWRLIKTRTLWTPRAA